MDDAQYPHRSGQLGAVPSYVAPGTKAQYIDELTAGGEYEILPDLKLGAAYIHRSLGRVMEDISTDGGNTYVIANPGEYDSGAVNDLRQQAMNSSDPAEAAQLQYEADLYEGAGTIFDKAYRNYNAFELTAERRFSKNFMHDRLVHVLAAQGQLPRPVLPGDRPARPQHHLGVRPSRPDVEPLRRPAGATTRTS